MLQMATCPSWWVEDSLVGAIKETLAALSSNSRLRVGLQPSLPACNQDKVRLKKRPCRQWQVTRNFAVKDQINVTQGQ
jgi:hypothetical protein